ncbi:MAG: SDR family oxidoreductase, partial [Polyangiaceae bacterium]
GFAGKRILITGAASGIGRALARIAARKGASLLITDVRPRELQRTAEELLLEGARVLDVRAFDISDFEATREFAHRVHERHGSVDILVNNAGIAVWGAVEHMTHADWRKVIDVNLMGPIHLIEAFLPMTIAAGRGGHLVNVSSAAGLFGLPWHAAYSASKFGVRGLSEVLRFDLEKHGIRVSLVCPGGVNTGLVDSVKVLGADATSDGYKRLRERFQRHAITPELAAARIVNGVEKNRYYVYTSSDIAVGHWFQRKFAWPYEFVMRRLNRSFDGAMAEGRVA